MANTHGVVDVLDTMEAVVREYGTGYIYRAPVPGSQNCEYFHDGEPSCINGHVFHRLGARIDDYVTGSVMDLYLCGDLPLKFTRKAVDAMYAAQQVQDLAVDAPYTSRDVTWGAALRAARASAGMLITKDQVIEVMEQVVREYGEGYVYTKVDGPVTGVTVCRYTENGRPSCLVGHVVRLLGLDLSLLDGCDQTASTLNNVYISRFSTEAIDAMQDAQEAQDVGYTWGRALSHARND